MSTSYSKITQYICPEFSQINPKLNQNLPANFGILYPKYLQNLKKIFVLIVPKIFSHYIQTFSDICSRRLQNFPETLILFQNFRRFLQNITLLFRSNSRKIFLIHICDDIPRKKPGGTNQIHN